jgi:hypothetical protein
MEFKYIRFVKIRDLPKTSVYECQNKSGGFSIGIVKWNTGWRQYCFYPNGDTVYSVGCMNDINTFIKSLKGVI